MLYALGETRSCDSTVCGSCFFLQASVVWFGWAPFPWVVMNTLIRSRLTYSSLPFYHAPILSHTQLLSMGNLNVAKCNLGKAKHDTMLASSRHLIIVYGVVLGFNIFYSTFPEVNHFAPVALAQFFLPAFPSLWMFFGKYMSTSPLKFSV